MCASWLAASFLDARVYPFILQQLLLSYFPVPHTIRCVYHVLISGQFRIRAITLRDFTRKSLMMSQLWLGQYQTILTYSFFCLLKTSGILTSKINIPLGSCCWGTFALSGTMEFATMLLGLLSEKQHRKVFRNIYVETCKSIQKTNRQLQSASHIKHVPAFSVVFRNYWYCDGWFFITNESTQCT